MGLRIDPSTWRTYGEGLHEALSRFLATFDLRPRDVSLIETYDSSGIGLIESFEHDGLGNIKVDLTGTEAMLCHRYDYFDVERFADFMIRGLVTEAVRGHTASY